MSKLRLIWKPYLADAKFKLMLSASTLLLAAALFSYRKFLDFAEARRGVVIPDPLLKLFEPMDLTWVIFGVIYLCLLIGILMLINNPEKLLLAFQAYTALVLVRMLMMYLAPFEAPEKLIVLQDPFVEMFGSGKALTKDLFFSGHTATLFLLFLVVDSKKMKAVFLLSTIVVGIAIVVQHVHYIIDVAAAPFFSFGCFRVVSFLKLYKLSK